jgi:hypothetical protein
MSEMRTKADTGLLRVLLLLAWAGSQTHVQAAWTAWLLTDDAVWVVPALLDQGIAPPLLYLPLPNHNLNPPLITTEWEIRLPEGINALALDAVSKRVLAASATCIRQLWPFEQRVAGNCLAPPMWRDGAPGVARFAALSHLATHDGLFAAIDSRTRLVVGTHWTVTTLHIELASAVVTALSLWRTSTRTVWLLLLTEAGTLLLARQSSTLAHWTWSAPLSDQDAPYARPLFACFGAHDALWLLDADQTVWRQQPIDVAPWQRTPAKVTLPNVTALALHASDPERPLWAIAPQYERFLLLPPLLEANASSACACLWGEVLLRLQRNRTTAACTRSPPGGYVRLGEFVPCPPGTHNPLTGAIHMDACLPCPPGTSAPVAGAAHCTLCPLTAPLQGPLGIDCVAQCPLWTVQCAACPLPGYAARPTTQGCAPCPAMTYAERGGPCLACREGFVSVEGMGACAPRNTDTRCFPSGSVQDAYTPPTPAVYTTSTPLPLDTTALVAMRNGTLWLGTATGGLQCQWQPDRRGTRRHILGASIPALALTADERTLFFVEHASGRSSYGRIMESGNDARVLGHYNTSLLIDLGLVNARSQWWLFGLLDSGVIVCLLGCPYRTTAITNARRIASYQERLLFMTVDGRVATLHPVFPGLSPELILRLDEPAAAAGPWMRVWNRGLLLGDGYAVRWWALDNATVSKTWGDPHASGRIDGLDPRFATPMRAQPFDLDRGRLLLADQGRLRVLWNRGCECAPDFFMHPDGACLPCSKGTTSPAGAAACSATCRAGQYHYRDPTAQEGVCLECPIALWWRDALTAACPLLYDTHEPRQKEDTETPEAMAYMTLIEAQTLVRSGILPYTVRCNFPKGLLLPPTDDQLLRADALGPGWWLDFTPLSVSDPDGVARFAAPALRCAAFNPVAATTNATDARWASVWLGAPGPPWNSARQAWRGEAAASLPPLFLADPTLLWPARFNCTSSLHYWDYLSFGCRRCPIGTFAYASDALRCVADTDSGPSVCGPGTTLELLPSSSRHTCAPCPTGTFSPEDSWALDACVPKQIRRCAPDEYIHDDGSGARDNQCLPCETPCATRVPFQAVCNGTTYHQPYVCLRPDVFDLSPGFRMQYVPHLRRAHPIWCGPTPNPYARWISGPQLELCYFRCLGEADLTAYYDTLPEAIWETDRFPYTDADAARAVCLPPVVQPCPEDTFRDTSGGCVPLETLPDHATPVPEGGWQCDPGWFRSTNASNPPQSVCAPCAASSCALGEHYRPAQCTPFSSGCSPCMAYAAEATLLLVVPGVCDYNCTPPFYPNTAAATPPCVRCGPTPPYDSSCPPGQAWNSIQCACAPCATLTTLGGTAVLAPTQDSVCRVWCRPGFLTLLRSTLQTVSGFEPQDPTQVTCVPCGQRPSLACPTCPPGTLAPRCTPCVAPRACPVSTYAPEGCVGGAAKPMPCLLCPAPLPPLRFFTGNGCTSACVRDTFYDPLTQQCRACRELPIPTGAPYALYRALWNATPDTRWWPSAYDPPHLPPRKNPYVDQSAAVVLAPESRAGKCWPCALSVRFVDDTSSDPCAIPISSGFDRVRLPVSLSFSFTFHHADTKNKNTRRRLLLSSSSSNGGGGARLLPASEATRCRSAYTLDRQWLEWCVPPPHSDGAAAVTVNRMVGSERPPPRIHCAPGTVVEDPWHPYPRCRPCPRGTWASPEGECRLCASPTPAGASACPPPPPRSTSSCVDRLSHPQPFHPTLCGCLPGTFLDPQKNHTCQRCALGTVSRSLGNAPCVPMR